MELRFTNLTVLLYSRINYFTIRWTHPEKKKSISWALRKRILILDQISLTFNMLKIHEEQKLLQSFYSVSRHCPSSFISHLPSIYLARRKLGPCLSYSSHIKVSLPLWLPLRGRLPFICKIFNEFLLSIKHCTKYWGANINQTMHLA